MKLTIPLLIATAALTSAAAVPTDLQTNVQVSQPSDAGYEIFQRGPGDDLEMKKECKALWKSDKTKHRDACTYQNDEDSRNLCMLRSLIGDGTEKCKAAMVKALGF